MKKQSLTLKARYEQKRKQADLKKKYGIEEEKVVVVERKSRIVQLWKATLRFLLILLQILATAAVAALAVVGLATLIYPDTRAEFIEFAVTTYNQVRQFVGL